MRRRFVEWDDFATAKKAPDLRLFWRAARLSDYGSWHQRNKARFEADPVLGPNPALGVVGGDQGAGVSIAVFSCTTDCAAFVP